VRSLVLTFVTCVEETLVESKLQVQERMERLETIYPDRLEVRVRTERKEARSQNVLTRQVKPSLFQNLFLGLNYKRRKGPSHRQGGRELRSRMQGDNADHSEVEPKQNSRSTQPRKRHKSNQKGVTRNLVNDDDLMGLSQHTLSNYPK
jgi:hypothetical protein